MRFEVKKKILTIFRQTPVKQGFLYNPEDFLKLRIMREILICGFRAERSIKDFVIGRKNFLFSNTSKGARSSAILYSLIETAKENELKPMDYLTWLFEKLPNIDWSDFQALQSLLPWSQTIPDSCRMPNEENNKSAST